MDDVYLLPGSAELSSYNGKKENKYNIGRGFLEINSNAERISDCSFLSLSLMQDIRTRGLTIASQTRRPLSHFWRLPIVCNKWALVEATTVRNGQKRK